MVTDTGGPHPLRGAGAQAAIAKEISAVPAAQTTNPRGLPVRLRDISKTYHDGNHSVKAIERFDLDVGAGEFVSVVGPSGCGKSTLLKIIAGLAMPTEGVAEVDGDPVKGPTTAAGVVFQRDLLLEWRNVVDNVLLQAEIRRQPVKRYRERARELLASVGLAGFEQAMPRALSGGMRQRVAICRALLHDPPLLLMDEPFGAVDAITRDQLNVDLRALCDRLGSTVVFITHSIPEAVFLADRVVVMSPRPATIAKVQRIELPPVRPLSIREEPEFSLYVRAIREVFEQMGVLASSGMAAAARPFPQGDDGPERGPGEVAARARWFGKEARKR